jgi:DNA (cytosine-5)-methyltransferase 1
MPIEAERLQGFPEGWTIPETPTGDPDRIDSLRYNALGNAVTVPVAKWIGKRIQSYLARQAENEIAEPIRKIG